MKLVFISKHFVGYTNGSCFLCFPTIIGFMGSYKKLAQKKDFLAMKWFISYSKYTQVCF
jgi:hypothetical protein